MGPGAHLHSDVEVADSGRIPHLALGYWERIFDQAYIVDQKNDDPEQFRAIGWCDARLCSVVFEIRYDDEGEYHHLVTAWTATKEEEESYAKNV